MDWRQKNRYLFKLTNILHFYISIIIIIAIVSFNLLKKKEIQLKIYQKTTIINFVRTITGRVEEKFKNFIFKDKIQINKPYHFLVEERTSNRIIGVRLSKWSASFQHQWQYGWRIFSFFLRLNKLNSNWIHAFMNGPNCFPTVAIHFSLFLLVFNKQIKKKFHL